MRTRAKMETINTEGGGIPGGGPALMSVLPPIPRVAVVRL
jgi:hypothetical protein